MADLSLVARGGAAPGACRPSAVRQVRYRAPRRAGRPDAAIECKGARRADAPWCERGIGAGPLVPHLLPISCGKARRCSVATSMAQTLRRRRTTVSEDVA